MKKRILFVLVLAVLAAGGAFALPDFTVSAGVGGYFTSDFGGGVEASASGITMAIKTPYVGGGGFAFLDVTYAELSAGFFSGGGKVKMEEPGVSTETDMSFAGLDIGFLGKYPVAVGGGLSVFPLLGITYRVVLSAKDADGNQYTNEDGKESPGDFSALWFKAGGGLDFSFTNHVFLRSEALYGIRLTNKAENDMVDMFKEYAGDGADVKALMGHGLEVKLALGYRF